MDKDCRLTTAEKRTLLDALLAKIHGAHQVADGKASMLFAASVALAGAIGATANGSTRDDAVLLWFFAAGLALASIALEAAAAFPRTRAKSPSCLFFGSINDMTVADFQKQIERLTNEDIVEGLYTQVHRNAQIAMTKFLFLKAGWIAFYAGGFLWLIYLWCANSGPK